MISTDYQEMLSLIHSGTKFGKRSKIPEHLKKFISKQAIRSMIDFGCGKGQLIDVLKHNYPTIDITGYDPANPKFDVPSARPRRAAYSHSASVGNRPSIHSA